MAPRGSSLTYEVHGSRLLVRSNRRNAACRNGSWCNKKEPTSKTGDTQGIMFTPNRFWHFSYTRFFGLGFAFVYTAKATFLQLLSEGLVVAANACNGCKNTITLSCKLGGQVLRTIRGHWGLLGARVVPRNAHAP